LKSHLPSVLRYFNPISSPLKISSSSEFNASACFLMVVAILFAFIPDLNFHASKGVSEPLFILTLIVMYFFILKIENIKYVFLSFLLLGLFWWVRMNGILAALSLTIIYFIYRRHSKNLFRNYVVCITIFLIVVSPILVQRYIQYGNPLFVAGIQEDPSVFVTFIEYELKTEERIMNSVKNTFTALYKVSLPYLIFLFPLGMLFSFWLTGQNKKNFKINWIFFISLILPTAIFLTAGPGTRWIFFLIPLLIIFSTLAIKVITESRFNPFSLNKKRQNIFLILVVAFVIISSGLFTHGIGKYGIVPPDAITINERIDYAKFLLNLDGKMFWGGCLSPQFILLTILEESDGDFKKYRINPERDMSYDLTELDSFNPSTTIKKQALALNSLEELILSGEEIGLKYLNTDGRCDFNFLNELYTNEESYPYLNKIFDWEEAGFQRYKVKAFEIDYEKFHQMKE